MAGTRPDVAQLLSSIAKNVHLHRSSTQTAAQVPASQEAQQKDSASKLLNGPSNSSSTIPEESNSREEPLFGVNATAEVSPQSAPTDVYAVSNFTPKKLIKEKQESLLATHPELFDFGGADDDDSLVDSAEHLDGKSLSATKYRSTTEGSEMLDVSSSVGGLVYDPTKAQQHRGLYSARTAKALSESVSDSSRSARYIDTLLFHSKKRKMEQQIIQDQQFRKEREKEADKFAGKEVFVTGGYAKKLEERKVLREQLDLEEQRHAARAVEKRKDLSDFHRHFLSSGLAARRVGSRVSPQAVPDAVDLAAASGAAVDHTTAGEEAESGHGVVPLPDDASSSAVVPCRLETNAADSSRVGADVSGQPSAAADASGPPTACVAPLTYSNSSTAPADRCRPQMSEMVQEDIVEDRCKSRAEKIREAKQRLTSRREMACSDAPP